MVQRFNPKDNYLTPASVRISRTRKVNPVNRNFFKTKGTTEATQSQQALGGPCIMFYLPDMKEPIELWNTAVIYIGRSDTNKTARVPLTVDLADHHGSLLGVSRLHAKIVYRDGCYFVKDLNSLNGTWVNEERVTDDAEVRLSTGDSLRLGHLIIQIGGYSGSTQ